VCELCTFYYYADFFIETNHAVGSSKDEVFSDWTVEYTVLAEFLLHPFSNVEDTTLFFVGHVLTPDISVWVVTELSFESAVKSVDKLDWLTIIVVSTISVLLRNVRLRHHEVIDRLRSWIRSFSSFFVSIKHDFFCFS